MKQITAIIKPFKLEEVREALADCGVTGYAIPICDGKARCDRYRASCEGIGASLDLKPRGA